ncbi:DEAD/DEAH box helicase [Rubrivirga sp. IMCC45206]|uniref:DEAD/DEAH box helicase n=1 Tax=Rubrivirga sp. IMCC45206 TaxID=3391614 RepID=UPI0039902FC1
MTFSDLHLRPELASTVADLGYTEPSPIQTGLIPVLLDGRDAIGQARTGTGKTAAFALPMLQKLAADSTRGVVRALVLCPTRELAVQVSSAVFTYGKALNVRVLPVYGGQPYHKQTRRLQQGVDVVVATPGRLVDLIKQQYIDLSTVETVVLDEADEMLSMGFADDLELILQATPSGRQTALLSATLPPRIRQIAGTYLSDPETIAVASGDRTAEDIEQRAYLVNNRDKLAALVRLLETEDVTSALAFVRTRHGATRLADELSGLGFAAEAISGDLSQSQRTAVLERFKRQQLKILVGTDVAARGLDIDHVSHVFNIMLPIDVEAYVHRVGRTGRAGREGTAISLVAPNERNLLSRVERYAKRQIPYAELPSISDVEAARSARMGAMVSASLDAATDADRRLVLDLVAEGEDPMRIAAAAFAVARIARGEASLPHIHTPHDRRSGGDRGPRHNGPRSNAPRNAREEGFVRMTIDAGYESGVRPSQVVSAIARTADIPGNVLGKILINDGQTLVDVPAGYVDQVLAQDNYRFGKHLAQIEVA